LSASALQSASPDALLERLAVARALGEAVDAHLSGGSCPWPERRHPDPFASASSERAAVEAAVQEQLR
jgi:hypothetical protein